MKHLPIGIIYGFISLISFMGTDHSTINIHTISILIGWIVLLITILNIQWFDKTTDGYFIFTILLFLAARLAKYNAPSVATFSTLLAIGVGMGLVVICCAKNHILPALCLLGIYGIEIGNIIILDDSPSYDLSDFIF